MSLIPLMQFIIGLLVVMAFTALVWTASRVAALIVGVIGGLLVGWFLGGFLFS